MDVTSSQTESRKFVNMLKSLRNQESLDYAPLWPGMRAILSWGEQNGMIPKASTVLARLQATFDNICTNFFSILKNIFLAVAVSIRLFQRLQEEISSNQSVISDAKCASHFAVQQNQLFLKSVSADIHSLCDNLDSLNQEFKSLHDRSDRHFPFPNNLLRKFNRLFSGSGEEAGKNLLNILFAFPMNVNV
ncbi:hypothetical protein BT69DRAFT_106450 [Atractiella rhizophila]|nr:hypothetical protein BT69DRAFT_106450 [Atractiella rhizophila]